MVNARTSLKLLIACVAGAAIVIAPAAHSSRDAHDAGPKTILSAKGLIRSFALGPNRLAWIDSTWGLHVKRGVGTSTVRYTSQYQEGGDPQLVFGGSRPIWLGNRGYPGVTQRVFTTGSSGAVRVVASAQHTDRNAGTYITSVAGDPAGAVFGRATVVETASSKARQCLCQFAVTGGGVTTVADGTAHPVPGLPPPVLVARAGADVALLPASTAPRSGAQPAAGAGAAVIVASLPGGGKISSFIPAGPVRALALSKADAFVLVATPTGHKIEVHAIATGALRRTIPAPGQISEELAVAGSKIVWHSRHTIWCADAATGKTSLVAHSTWAITRVDSEASTLAWAQRLTLISGDDTSPQANLGRISEVVLPVR